MSNVSLINEWCHSKNVQFPTFSYTVEMIDLKPSFRCCVSLKYREKTIYSQSENQASKKEAKEQAAKLLYSRIQKEDSIDKKANILKSASSKPTNSLTTNILYTNIFLVDLENVNYTTKVLDKNTLYIGFIASNHKNLNSYSSWKRPESYNLLKESRSQNNLLYMTKGGVKEMTDHYITWFSWFLVKYAKTIDEKIKVFIITCDNSSWCTTICLKNSFSIKGMDDKIEVENLSS